MKVSERDLLKTRVSAVVVNGRVAYEATSSPPLLLKGDSR
jgi:molybdopterin-binding protein